MRTPSRSSISPAIARTITATVIAVILVAANFTVINNNNNNNSSHSSNYNPVAATVGEED
jgi:hypothetical protein